VLKEAGFDDAAITQDARRRRRRMNVSHPFAASRSDA